MWGNCQYSLCIHPGFIDTFDELTSARSGAVVLWPRCSRPSSTTASAMIAVRSWELWLPSVPRPRDVADPHFEDSPMFPRALDPAHTVRFAGDGPAFVAEKRGIIKEYDSVNDSTAIQVLDIRKDVHDFWDRGLLSIALDPDFLAGEPVHLRVLRLRRKPPVSRSPYWPSGQTAPGGSICPTPPGRTTDGCTSPAGSTGTRPTGLERRGTGQPPEPDRHARTASGASSSRATRAARSPSAPDG